LRIACDAAGYRATLEPQIVPKPAPGEVLIRVAYSSVNYKDALAGTGRGKILKTFPLIGGIDASGWVVESAHPGYRADDPVIATGWGMGVTRDGGYANYLCVPGAWLQPLPAGLTLREAMILGTAGLAAALAVRRLLDNGQCPERGPLLVTGASGGVGCIAIAILARLGFEVVALSGKGDLHDWLRRLGASRVIPRAGLSGTGRALEHAVWGGAIDTVGGDTLARILPAVVLGGNVASVGLAGGADFATTVMPFILRGIALLGCNTVDLADPLRRQLWQRLADDWQPPRALIHTATIALDALPEVFVRVLDGRGRGRILVDFKAEPAP